MRLALPVLVFCVVYALAQDCSTQPYQQGGSYSVVSSVSRARGARHRKATERQGETAAGRRSRALARRQLAAADRLTAAALSDAGLRRLPAV